jgi:hypothetical protein
VSAVVVTARYKLCAYAAQIVDDEFLIALDLEASMRELGFTPTTSGGLLVPFVMSSQSRTNRTKLAPVHTKAPGFLRLRQGVATPRRGLFGDLRLSLAFLGWRGRAWIAAFINRASSGLIRYRNRIAFVFGTRGAYGCAGSAGCIQSTELASYVASLLSRVPYSPSPLRRGAP